MHGENGVWDMEFSGPGSYFEDIQLLSPIFLVRKARPAQNRISYGHNTPTRDPLPWAALALHFYWSFFASVPCGQTKRTPAPQKQGPRQGIPFGHGSLWESQLFPHYPRIGPPNLLVGMPIQSTGLSLQNWLDQNWWAPNRPIRLRF